MKISERIAHIGLRDAPYTGLRDVVHNIHNCKRWGSRWLRWRGD